MDEITLLRELRSETEGPSPASTSAARARLLASMAEPESAARVNASKAQDRTARRRPVLRRSAWVLGAAAVAVAVTLVATEALGGIGERGGASAEAAQVLNDAAAAAIQSSDPVVGPGQYLKIETRAEYLSSYSTSEDASATDRATIDTQNEDLFVPSDLDEEWLQVKYARIPVRYFPPEFETEFARSFTPDPMFAEDYTLHGNGGDFLGMSAQLPNFDSYPLDPDDLYAYLLANANSGALSTPGPGVEEHVIFQKVSDDLRTGMVPADLRAAMYTVLEHLDGVEIAEYQVTLNGRVGVAIGRNDFAGRLTSQIIIDPKTGLVIGERQVNTTAVGVLPAGLTTGSTSVTTSVVDGIPGDLPPDASDEILAMWAGDPLPTVE